MNIHHEIAIRDAVRYALMQTSIGIRVFPKTFWERKEVKDIVRDELRLYESTGAITVFDMEEAVEEMISVCKGGEADEISD